MDFVEIEPEELPPSQWDAAVQEKCQQVMAEGNKALPAQSGKENGKDPNQNNVQIVDTSYLTGNQGAGSLIKFPFLSNGYSRYTLMSSSEFSQLLHQKLPPAGGCTSVEPCNHERNTGGVQGVVHLI